MHAALAAAAAACVVTLTPHVPFLHSMSTQLAALLDDPHRIVSLLGVRCAAVPCLSAVAFGATAVRGWEAAAEWHALKRSR